MKKQKKRLLQRKRLNRFGQPMRETPKPETGVPLDVLMFMKARGL